MRGVGIALDTLRAADSVRAFQEQWTAEHPDDPLIADGIVGIATMVRGWRPYRTYGIA